MLIKTPVSRVVQYYTLLHFYYSSTYQTVVSRRRSPELHPVVGEDGDGGLDVVGAEADVLQPGPGELSQEPAHTQLQRGGAGAGA